MLDRLAIPPRMVLRALEDLHTVAEALPKLAASVRELPRVEDELSAEIASLRAEVKELREWLDPLHRELSDLDDTGEALEKSLSTVNESILGLQTLLKKLPGI